jgi:murein DD-endopeptidase MepM/ murein hydrolase activator NlpD
MPRRRVARAIKLGAVAALLTATFVPAISGPAAGGESLKDLQAKMDSIQADLDAATAEIEELTQERALVEDRIAEIEDERERMTRRQEGLEKKAVARATLLYKSGTMGTLEVLLSADNFNELETRADLLSRVSLEEQGTFLKLARSKLELAALDEELVDKRAELAAAEAETKERAESLDAQFASVQEEYEELKRELAQLAQAAPDPAPVAAAAAAPATVMPKVTGDMTCPVAGPVSFVDSWGAPRSGGRSHEGVDMMAATGTPVAAIVSGTITLSSYGESAGNWQILSGDDGNSYWYMHNDQNLVNSGHVKVGTQIATVGGTGNASESAPHLHFEFHPGGGGPVNPYPLVASLC